MGCEWMYWISRAHLFVQRGFRLDIAGDFLDPSGFLSFD